MHNLENTNNEIIIAGDFNINLLKIQEKPAFNTFFEIMTSNSFFPLITLPTRFSNTRGTLIDNFFAKISSIILNANAGIILDKLSDHLPYFICLDTIKMTCKFPKFITISVKKPTALEDLTKELASLNIFDSLDHNPNCDPNKNYEILENHIMKTQANHFKTKKVKFKKHTHKRCAWITKGLLISIKKRDLLYKTKLMTMRDSDDYANLNTNLSTFNKILRKTIKDAKRNYYERKFNEYKLDMRKTWSCINNILNKTVKNSQTCLLVIERPSLRNLQ